MDSVGSDTTSLSLDKGSIRTKSLSSLLTTNLSRWRGKIFNLSWVLGIRISSDTGQPRHFLDDLDGESVTHFGIAEGIHISYIYLKRSHFQGGSDISRCR
jgi:hypothetical protein